MNETRPTPAIDWFRENPSIEISDWIPAPDLRPDQVGFVIGDAHGHSDALGRVLDAMSAHREVASSSLLYDGDLCDRGADTLGVLAQVLSPDTRFDQDVVLGNHDVMFLEILRRSREREPFTALFDRWLQFGGNTVNREVGELSEEDDGAPYIDHVISALAVRAGTSVSTARDMLDRLAEKGVGRVDGNMLITHAGVPADLDKNEIPRFLTKERGAIRDFVEGREILAPFILDPKKFQLAGRPPACGYFVVHGHYPECLTYPDPHPFPSLDAHRHDPGTARLGLDGSYDTRVLSSVVGVEVDDQRYRVYRAPVVPGATLLDADAHD